MYCSKAAWLLLLFLEFISCVHGQGVLPATVGNPTIESKLGGEARLLCASTKNSDGSVSGLKHCVWERVQSSPRSNNAFIINFNEINSLPGLFSGMAGYSYSGEGFPNGECGVKVSVVKAEDYSRWHCTLISDDDKVYRGYVTLEKPEPEPTPAKNSTGVAVASSRTAINDETDMNRETKPRPIITSYNDARAIIQPEIVIQRTDGEGAQLIQEVKVESAGLQIKPRRAGKLIVFE